MSFTVGQVFISRQDKDKTATIVEVYQSDPVAQPWVRFDQHIPGYGVERSRLSCASYFLALYKD